MKKHILLISLITFSYTLLAQSEVVDDSPKSIQSSYDKMIKSSNRYQDYKVVKRYVLDGFMKEVQDSLDVLQKKISAQNRTKKDLSSQIQELNNNLAAEQQRSANLENSKESFETLGMSINKSVFAVFTWTAIISLLALLGILLMKHKASLSDQRSMRARLNELEEDLGSTKKKALEREQELKREVQDYINKLEAMGPPR